MSSDSEEAGPSGGEAPLPLGAEAPEGGPGSAERLVEIAVPVPLRRRFTYRLPDELGEVALGTRVAVRFARRLVAGIVTGFPERAPEGVRLSKVAGRLDAVPLFEPELLRFLEEAASYYMHPVGEVLRAAAPALPRDAMRRLEKAGAISDASALRGASVATRKTWVVRATGREPERRLGAQQQEVLDRLRASDELTLDELSPFVKAPRSVLRRLEARGLVAIDEREVASDPFFSARVERDVPPVPNAAQEAAVRALIAALGDEGSTHLLHGVTGSGKTEVYLRVIDEARRRGRGALLLVPEIALTPQLVGRFRARFGDDIAVLHSGLTDKQRHAAWWGLRRGELSLAVGARSAIFAPVRELGVIVVDEEHDTSFKQEDQFRYHARDLAILRAHRAGALCILGSATPSIESYQRAVGGKIGHLSLPERATSQTLPTVEVVDLRQHRAGPSGHPLLSAPLHRAIEQCLMGENQAILFLNRRGFASSVRCDACGEVVFCPACSVALTEHRRAGLLRCHYCDFCMPARSRCPSCRHETLVPLGLGTERLEDTLSEAFAPARVARLDRDTASGGRGVEAVLGRLRRREIDILVGTQMVTKGHDMPGVTVVGIVLADQSLAFPDFRASERTFQLLSQVAGRAGRGERPGRVILQTFQPEHPSVVCAQRHDYRSFAMSELEGREMLSYPPFGRLASVRIDAADESRASRVASELADHARAHRAVRGGHVEVLGPSPSPIARLRARYRFRFMLRARERPALRAVARVVVQRIEAGLTPARAHVDLDPVSML